MLGGRLSRPPGRLPEPDVKPGAFLVEPFYTYASHFPQKVFGSGSGSLYVALSEYVGTSGYLGELSYAAVEVGTVYGTGVVGDPTYGEVVGGDIFTLDADQPAVYKNGSLFFDLSSVSAGPNGSGLAVRPADGTVWVTDFNDDLFEINASGSAVTTHTLSMAGWLAGLVWVDDVLHLTDAFGKNHLTYTPGIGFGSKGTFPGGFTPRDVTWAPQRGRLFFGGSGGGSAVMASTTSAVASSSVDLITTAQIDGGTAVGLTVVGQHIYLSVSGATGGVTIWRAGRL